MHLFPASRSKRSEWDHTVFPTPFNSLALQLGTDLQYKRTKRTKAKENSQNGYRTITRKFLYTNGSSPRESRPFSYITVTMQLWLHSHSAVGKSSKENLHVSAFLLVLDSSLLHFGFQVQEKPFSVFHAMYFYLPFPSRHNRVKKKYASSPRTTNKRENCKSAAAEHSLALPQKIPNRPGLECRKHTRRHRYRIHSAVGSAWCRMMDAP